MQSKKTEPMCTGAPSESILKMLQVNETSKEQAEPVLKANKISGSIDSEILKGGAVNLPRIENTTAKATAAAPSTKRRVRVNF